METKIEKNGMLKSTLITFGALAFVILIASIILHTTPLAIANDIVDFAAHHQFLAFFISLTVLLVCVKLYFSYDEKKVLKNPKHITRRERLAKRIQRVQNYGKNVSLKIQMIKSQNIEKEKIKELPFSELDVLTDYEDIKRREEDLQRAMKLGNNFKHKVKIFFKDLYSHKHAETTIWHANNKHVTLKGGIVIPVKSIYKISI